MPPRDRPHMEETITTPKKIDRPTRIPTYAWGGRIRGAPNPLAAEAATPSYRLLNIYRNERRNPPMRLYREA